MEPELIAEVRTSAKILTEGGTIVYPTDTVWGIGCDATDPLAVARIFDLKQRPDSRALICLVSDQAMLERYLETVPDVAYDLLDLATKPLTIIYDRPKGIAPNLLAPDGSLGIRVATDTFCKYLIGRLKRPIVSTSANVSGQPTPCSFDEIAPVILKGVDYVVNLHREKRNGPASSIIKLGNDGTVKVIRE